MHYLYKLKFPYGVHFGADKAGIGLEKISPNCHCDTLYSAICIEILKLYGEEKLTEFVNDTKDGKFLFSDLLPFRNNELMIPKPIFFKEKSEDEQAGDSVKKKKMKKLQFVPISKLKEYFDGKDLEEVKFCKSVVYEKNAPARDGNDKENGLYSVGVTRFLNHEKYDNGKKIEIHCGLYFIVKMEEDKREWFGKVLKSLQYSGLGGKRTSGYGQFEIVDDFELDENSNIAEEALFAKLLNKESKYYLSLSAFCPQKEEITNIKKGYYSLIQRQGFVQSTTYTEEGKLLKKIPTTMINAGSCFEEKVKGEVIDVSKDGEHPVYRYGKPIMIGIDV